MNKQLTCGSLFAGIGGFDLGFERAGIKTVWQVEQNEFCRAVLAKNFPEADRSVTDVRRVRANGRLPWVNVIAGGFPCQDISKAGRGAGLAGARSGLWSQMRRIIRAFRPDFVVVENVSALLGRGLGTVLGDLAASGYDAEWDCLPAASVGAPHLRDRVFIIAYPNADSERFDARRKALQKLHSGKPEPWRELGQLRGDVADTDSAGLPDVQGRAPSTWKHGDGAVSHCGWWDVEPAVGRVVDGVRHRMDRHRLAALGNAVVPQIAEWIGKRIIQAASGIMGPYSQGVSKG